MKKSALYVPPILLLLFFQVIRCFYWFGSIQGPLYGQKFPPNTSCLYGLDVPTVLEQPNLCNETCRDRERDALVTFYSETNGKQWLVNGNWNRSTVPHCDWRGVLCDFQSGHVISISLPDTNLKGHLTWKLRNIQFLLGICLSRNGISERMERIGHILPKYIIRFCLAYNQINGFLPANLSTSLPLLAKLQLTGNNKLSGSLTEDICNLRHLQVLSIGETEISGPVPASIGKLNRLWFLDFEALKMTGNMSIFRNLSNIKWLHLSSNQFTGTIPSDMGYIWPNLLQLLLQNNLLHGSLPHSLGLLTNLKVLNVAKNKLTGEIPSSMAQLKLEVFIFSDNLFDGFADNFLQNSTQLSIFLGSNNRGINCTMQRILRNLSPAIHTLRQLDMSRSNISGDLPITVFDFKKLTFLKLADNNLSGSLPIPLENMPYMTQVDLSHNQFTGAIPMSFSRLLMLLNLDLRYNAKMQGGVMNSFLKLDSTLSFKDSAADTCPTLRFSHNDGVVYVDPSYYRRKYCFCDEHYYGYDGLCYPCMLNGICPGRRKAQPSSKDSDFSANMFVKKGFWPFPDAKNANRLLRCPASLFHNNVCVPGERCKCWLEQTEVTKPQVKCNQSCLCAEGHTGRFCSQCTPDHYEEGIRCIKCLKGASSNKQIAILATVVVIALVVTSFVVYISKKARRKAVIIAIFEIIAIIILASLKIIPAFLVQALIVVMALTFNRQNGRCKGIFKTAVFYFQIMDTLVATTDIWPASVYKAQAYVGSSFNLNFSGIACLFPEVFSLFVKQLFLFLLPVMGAGLVWSFYAVWSSVAERDEHSSRMAMYRCRHYSLLFTELAYFPIVKATLSVITKCREVDGIKFMKNFPWINCNGSEYYALLVMSWLAVAFYVIGIPFFLYAPLLYRNRKDLSDETSDATIWLGSLYLAYKPRFRLYMELIMSMRRLLLALLLTAVNESQQTQVTLITTFLIICITFQALARPFASPSTSNEILSELPATANGLENILELSTLGVVLLSFISTRMSSATSPPEYFSLLFIVTIAANSLLIIFLGIGALYRLLPYFGKNRNLPTNERPLLSVIDEDPLQ